MRMRSAVSAILIEGSELVQSRQAIEPAWWLIPSAIHNGRMPSPILPARVARPPELTQDIQRALQVSGQCSDRLYQHFPENYPASLRADLATRWLGLCLEHREAFLLLVAYDARRSAAALIRPVYESYVKGYWAANVATDAQVDLAARNQVPKLENVARQVSDFLDRTMEAAHRASQLTDSELAERRGSFMEMKRAAWNRLSDFAHSGTSQLQQALGDEVGGADRQDGNVVLWTHFVDLQAVLACVALLDVAGQEAPDDLLEVSREIQERSRLVASQTGVQDART